MTCKQYQDRIDVIPSKKINLIHVETELGIINITLNLMDRKFRRVENISISPNNYVGEKLVKKVGNRLIEFKKVRK